VAYLGVGGIRQTIAATAFGPSETIVLARIHHYHPAVSPERYRKPSRGPLDERLVARIALHPARWGLLSMGVPGVTTLILCRLFTRPAPETVAWTVAGAFIGAVLFLGGLHDRQRGRSLIAEAHSVEDLRALGWRGFEELVRAAYRSQRWVVDSTNNTSDADGGADIILTRRRRRLLVQAKQTRGQRTVGVDKVRELLGVVTAAKAQGGILVTCGEFTHEAERFAAGNGIELVNGKQLLRLIGQPTEQPPTSDLAVTCPPCTRCGGPTHLVQKPLAPSSYYGCNAYPDCWCRIPLSASS
jgi:restriction system protein